MTILRVAHLVDKCVQFQSDGLRAKGSFANDLHLLPSPFSQVTGVGLQFPKCQRKNIMHKKGKQDAIRSKLFSKLAREITVAASSACPTRLFMPLRAAVIAARAENMPKDNIERAIKKASAADSENYDEVRYEGYGRAVWR